MASRSPARTAQSGAAADRPCWPPPVMRIEQFLRFLVVGGDLSVAHERLGLLEELIVAPAALVLELAQLGLEHRRVLAVEVAQGRRRPRSRRPRNRPSRTPVQPGPKSHCRCPTAPAAAPPPPTRPPALSGSLTAQVASTHGLDCCVAQGRASDSGRAPRSMFRTTGPNLLDFGNPRGAIRPAWARWPTQSRSSDIRQREGAPGRIEPGQAFLLAEHAHIRQAAVLVALQDHALAARHLVHLVEREDQHLAVLADGGDHVAVGGHAAGRLPPARSRSSPACPCGSWRPSRPRAR